LLAWAIVATIQQNYYLLAVGIPAAAGPLFLLPWLIALLTAGAAVFCLLAWIQRWWPLPGRVYYSLVTAACIAFVAWIAQLGLM
jgi:hypothetical protein